MELPKQTQRSRLEMKADFLRSLRSGPLIQNRIIQLSNLTYSTMKEMSEELLNRGLIEKQGSTFALTAKGFLWISSFDQLRSEI
jgi:predicted transcriptional regulator